MFARIFALCVLCLSLFFGVVTPAHAEITMVVVDVGRAIHEINEGKTADARLQAMYKDRKAQIDGMKAKFDAMQADYQKQQMILNDESRRQKEEELSAAYMQLQQAVGQSEQDMQEANQNAMATLAGKMNTVVSGIAKERNYTIVVQSGEASAVLWASPTIDITDEVIKRYNAQNPGK